MQKQLIEISGLNSTWEILLYQIGIDFSPFNPKGNGKNILIITRDSKIDLPLSTFKNKLLLIEPAFAGRYYQYKKKYTKYLYVSENDRINSIDFYKKLYSFTKLKKDRYGCFRISESSRILPFNLDEIFSYHGRKRKKFFYDRKELPSELVGKTDFAGIRKFIELLLIDLFENLNLPFAQKSFLPDNKNLFLFRIDTDFADLDDVKKLQRLLEKYAIRASWFIEANNGEKIRNFYSKLESQEIGLHCYRHKVFNNYKRNFLNIKYGKKILQNHGIIPTGFVAPFGEWNDNLGMAIEDCGFQYSSEFSLSYDNLPFFSLINGRKSNVLQIPIHPISLGRLRRSHFSQKEMISYFEQIIEKQVSMNEPIAIYHHPSHQFWDVLEHIFKQVKNFNNMTFNEYSTWWRRRVQQKMEIQLDSEKAISKFPALLKTKDKFCKVYSDQLERFTLKLIKHKKLHEKDLNRLHNFSWRDWLYNYESFRGKYRQ